MNIKFGCFDTFFNSLGKRNINVEANIVASSHYSLTPSTIERNLKIKDGETERIEVNKAYQPILDIAGKLNGKEIKNIALTGPFGSGKSSVLLTLQKDFPQYNYLNISLATLDCLDKKKKEISTAIKEGEEGEKSNSTNDIKKSGNSDQVDDESLNRKIEYSILQQLIYKEKSESIPQSRFKRIRHISNDNSCKLAIGIVLFILSCCILLDPKLLRIQSLNNFFICSENWKTFWDIILFAYVLIAAIFALKKLIIKTYNNRINKPVVHLDYK